MPDSGLPIQIWTEPQFYLRVRRRAVSFHPSGLLRDIWRHILQLRTYFDVCAVVDINRKTTHKEMH